MAYLSVTEVNSAIQGLAGAFPTLSTLINLPNNSVLGKKNLALRIGEPNSPKSKGVLFTGCTHAREWAGAEICIFFASDILTAFRDGHGVGYGSKTFTRNQIRQILETVDLFVFPCVNPDGREFSMANDPVGGPNGWRKNRRPVAGGQVGIDLNRNYDFLWDFSTKFAASAINLNLASNNPADLTYHGTAPATEPEIQNVIWLLDNFPQIGFYMDIHNFVVPGDLLFNWGDAPNQRTNPAMTFTNLAFDGQRGVNNVAQYGEFITPDDQLTVQALAQRTGAAIAASRGHAYVPKPAFNLYATSGASDDYVTSRSIVDATKGKVHGFTMEFEATGGSFHPTWTDIEPAVIEADAGLAQFCLSARNIHKSAFFIRDRSHVSAQEVQPFITAGMPAIFPEAVYLVLDGYTLAEATAATVALDLRWADDSTPVPGASASAGTPLLEDPSVPDIAQRITVPCGLRFDTSAAFAVLGGSSQRDVILRSQPGDVFAETVLTLFRDSKPFMKDGPTSWLSIDVRVASLQPNMSLNPSLVLGASETPLHFIERAVNLMNTPAGAGLFDMLSTDPDDSRLEISSHVSGQPVSNFAFAKLRFQAPSGVDATDARMFFRLFTTAATSLNYDTSTVYPRIGDGPGSIPQIGSSGGARASIPFFAAARDGSMLAPADPVNVRTVHGVGTAESFAFFGCWLDFNQNATIQSWIRGQHQCLVAELQFPAFPIPPNATPADNDSLAQRNLVIVDSDNPGGPEAHTVQHTFLLKSSSLGVVTPGAALAVIERPDELLIRWFGLPHTSVVEIYLPDTDVEKLLRISEERLGPTVMELVDAHTLRCKVGDALYLPLPASPSIAGLMSIQLPIGVRQGQRFHVVAQQVMGNALRIAGSFQFDIPVSLGPLLLRGEERRFAVLSFIAQRIPAGDVWQPVFERYTGQIAKRIRAFGGSPQKVPPSASGGPGDQPGAIDGTGNLVISFSEEGGGMSSDIVDVALAHQTLSDRREIRNWPARRDLVVPDLISTNTGIYLVRIAPRQHQADGQFATVEEGRNTRVPFGLKRCT